MDKALLLEIELAFVDIEIVNQRAKTYNLVECNYLVFGSVASVSGDGL